MPNNYLSVLYKHIIQVENKNVGLKMWGGGGGHKHTNQKSGGHMPLLHTPPISYASVCVRVYVCVCVYIYISGVAMCQKVGGHTDT